MKNVSKILLVIPSLAKGGAERLCIDIQRYFQSKTNMECTLLTFRDKNDYAFMTSDLNIKCIPSEYVPSISGKSHKSLDALQYFINEYQPDLIHSHLFEAEIVLSQIQLPKSTQRIVHVHDNMPQLAKKIRVSKESLANQLERKLVLKQLKKHQAKFVCISKDTFNYVDKNIGSWQQKKLIHNAIDLERFSFQPKTGGETNLVMIGSLVDKKGHALAIRTMKELTNKQVSFHLDILGNGPLLSKLTSLVEELALQDKVTFHGAVDLPETLLHQAKFFLHTASYEPFGLVLIEAMATGTPVITTDGKGNRDVMNGNNGLFVKHRDPKKLAKEIIALSTDQQRQQAYIEAGLKTAKQHGIDQYGEALLNWYQA